MDNFEEIGQRWLEHWKVNSRTSFAAALAINGAVTASGSWAMYAGRARVIRALSHLGRGAHFATMLLSKIPPSTPHSFSVRVVGLCAAEAVLVGLPYLQQWISYPTEGEAFVELGGRELLALSALGQKDLPGVERATLGVVQQIDQQEIELCYAYIVFFWPKTETGEPRAQEVLRAWMTHLARSYVTGTAYTYVAQKVKRAAARVRPYLGGTPVFKSLTQSLMLIPSLSNKAYKGWNIFTKSLRVTVTSLSLQDELKYHSITADDVYSATSFAATKGADILRRFHLNLELDSTSEDEVLYDRSEERAGLLDVESLKQRLDGVKVKGLEADQFKQYIHGGYHELTN